MSKDFKVGDRVLDPCNGAIGNIVQIYRDIDNRECAFIKWSASKRTWHHAIVLSEHLDLEHYQEPLKYGSGEEAKVGDIVYHSRMGVLLQVLSVNKCAITAYGIMEHHKSSYMEFHSMVLKLRLGELYDR